MKIVVLPRPIEGASREDVLKHASAEIRAVWTLYEQGICREFYTRLDKPGVVLILECASMEAAQEALGTLPFAQLHLIDFDLIPLAPYRSFAQLFQQADP
jgi:hypothetical protein